MLVSSRRDSQVSALIFTVDIDTFGWYKANI